jgi:hypothetical protein
MGVLHVNPEVLERIERRIVVMIHEIRASAVLLIDRSGLVLAWAGDPPLHPNQLGAVAAGISAATRSLIKANRTADFTVSVNEAGTNFHFQNVEEGTFLLAVYPDHHDAELVRSGLDKLAQEARKTLTSNQPSSAPVESVSFIEEKLNELFRN